MKTCLLLTFILNNFCSFQSNGLNNKENENDSSLAPRSIFKFESRDQVVARLKGYDYKPKTLADIVFDDGIAST